MSPVSSVVLMHAARRACLAAGARDGEFTPIVLERYSWVAGQRGIKLGRPLAGDRAHVDWSFKATPSDRSNGKNNR